MLLVMVYRTNMSLSSDVFVVTLTAIVNETGRLE